MANHRETRNKAEFLIYFFSKGRSCLPHLFPLRFLLFHWLALPTSLWSIAGAGLSLHPLAQLNLPPFIPGPRLSLWWACELLTCIKLTFLVLSTVGPILGEDVWHRLVSSTNRSCQCYRREFLSSSPTQVLTGLDLASPTRSDGTGCV